MDKVLIEGSGCMGDSCVSNLTSTEWLFDYPSIMVWADSILISEQDYAFLSSGHFEHNDSGISEDFAQLISSLKDEAIVEVYNPLNVLPDISRESVIAQVQHDLDWFGIPASERDQQGKVEPAHILYDNMHICPVVLESIYSSLLTSRLLGCTCIMDRKKASFAFSRFGTSYPSSSQSTEVFNELYSVLVPELRIYRDYRLFCPTERKNKCVHGDECIQQRSKNVIRFIDDLRFLRDNPDLKALKKLIDKKESDLGPEDDQLKNAVLRDISRAQKRLFESYPAAQKWMKYIATVSSSAIAAISSSASEALLPIAGILGATQILDVKIRELQQKEHWKIGFCDSFHNVKSAGK